MSAAAQDMARAAFIASVHVTHALQEPLTPRLFEESYLAPLEVGRRTKTKALDELGAFLKSHGAEPSEIRYVVNVTRAIVRKSSVVRRAKAGGIIACQLCNEPFFVSKAGRLYCQVAHIKPLQDNGRDSIDNVLLLCACCHAQLDMERNLQLSPIRTYCT